MSEDLFKIEDVGEQVAKLGLCEINNNPDAETFDIVQLKEVEQTVTKSKPITLQDFEIKKVLGTGGFAKVFQVKKVNGNDTGKIYAMKVLKKAALVRNKQTKHIEREINVHAKLERDVLESVKHPFIVDLIYAFQAQNKVYLILEYLAGGELFMMLQKERMLMEETAIFYLSQILLALAHLHATGIIYRDLKPENIMLDREGHVKLTDFGCVKLSLEDEVNYTFCGTVEYMAPEIINRTGRHGKEVDWWSFGILIHDMLTGTPPFTGNNRKMVTERVLKQKLSLRKCLTPDAKDIITRLLNRKAENRLGSGERDGEAVKTHRFFSGVDWDAVIDRRNPPPFLPTLKSEDDISNFDEEFTSKPPYDSPLGSVSDSVSEVFIGFSYNGQQG
eukprot:TRINITY_DN29818_c0_g1_i10.p1 TRINITY_DN29818_c0_g1~~TRINITY_DN29818_c0_g1_i10.p1  ORF type:complete len:389 (-),score=104.93 TRINITY_DN29818_c0_g1_i10:236-1402(-)